MRFYKCYLILILCFVEISASAQELPSGVVVRDAVVYRVKMKTIFVVPTENDAIDRIRVWHALPTRRPWSNTVGDVGAAQIKSSSGGTQLYKKLHDSHHNYWDIDEPQKPGKRHRFSSQFTVRSVQRDFLPGAVNVKWEDYQTVPEDPEAKVNPERANEVHPKLAAVADAIKRVSPPPTAVHEFCKWIDKTITYDASVSYSTRDIDAIVEHCRGHCGHHSHVFRQLCWRAGIPMRRVRGLNLNTPKGRGRLHAIKADYTNVHTWAEVYFPGIGWIEVEPSNGKHAFRIPAQCIQNNMWFQNYSIWIRENGKSKQDTWAYNNGKYISDYGVENLITFSERGE